MGTLRRKPHLIERISTIVFSIMVITLVLAIASALINQRWFVLFVSTATLLLVFVPVLFERWYKIDLPVEAEFAVVIFVYASLFLGEVHNYYARFWWWDIFLHGLSGIALAFFGFMILFILYRGKKIAGSPWIIAVFSFCFAMALGGVWEIFEFSMDQLFGTNMQKTGLVDTMWDLIVDAGGALLVSLLGFFYLKYGKIRFFDSVMNRFTEDNPELFKK